MNDPLLTINLRAGVKELLEPFIKALTPYDYHFVTTQIGPQGLQGDVDEMAHIIIKIPTTAGEVAPFVWTTIYADGSVHAEYEYEDERMNELLGGETYSLGFFNLISYLEQLPKPFSSFTSGLVQD